jgi:hypothetical protein
VAASGDQGGSIPKQVLHRFSEVQHGYKQHRDLHGLNILVRNEQEQLLIDYAEVGPAPACLDPLILELSLLFHPACRDLCTNWPTVERGQHWADINAFLINCPFDSFLRACRTWAFDSGPGDKAVFATAYSYAVRQIKYSDTDHELAIAIAQAAYKRFTSD